MEFENAIDFVFMMSCQGVDAARIFLNRGAHHVIGINRENKVSSDDVLLFTQTFYSVLWSENSSICSCFSRAKLAVEIASSS